MPRPSLGQILSDHIALQVSETVRKFDIKLDNNISLFAGLLGIGQTLAGYPLLSKRVYDFVLDLYLLFASIECRHLD